MSHGANKRAKVLNKETHEPVAPQTLPNGHNEVWGLGCETECLEVVIPGVRDFFHSTTKRELSSGLKICIEKRNGTARAGGVPSV